MTTALIFRMDLAMGMLRAVDRLAAAVAAAIPVAAVATPAAAMLAVAAAVVRVRADRHLEVVTVPTDRAETVAAIVEAIVNRG